MEEKNDISDNIKYYILDTSFFIKIRPLDLLENNKYICTQYIINEIKDKNAREYYELKKSFINIVNPSKESIKHVSQFAKKSNDLSYLSIADISIIALAYETICKMGKENLLNKEPLNYTIIDKDKIDFEIRKKEKEKQRELMKKLEEEEKEEEEEFNNNINTNSNNENNNINNNENNNINNNENNEEENYDNTWNENGDDDDEGDWITPENLKTKLNEIKGVIDKKETDKEKENNKINKTENNKNENNNKNIINNIFIYTTDYTIQNVSLKMGIPVIGFDGLQIKKIKNYIFKCTICENFIFDTSKKFCDLCGYPDLMKIGYNIYSDGNIRINDKKPQIRKRGNQFDLPKPKIGKKGIVYILAEDQIPKKKINNDINIDKILDNYSEFKEMSKPQYDLLNSKTNSSKQYVWGYPKQNPNKAKKYYNKKRK